MQLSSTSTQRTYRYLRISIVGAVAALAASLVAVVVADGAVTSLSALFYTPGRTVFTGVLFAIALALLALSGHSLEQILLDLAALFAPLIAIIPTPIQAGDAPGVDPECSSSVPCVPADAAPDVRNGIVTFAVIAVLGVVLALVLARVQRTASTGVLVAAPVAVIVAIGVIGWMLTAPDSLLRLGHLVATGAFFALTAAVAVTAAITSADRWRALYAGVAIGMAAFLVYLGIVMIARLAGADQTGQPWILVGESGLVVLFAVFWIAQTVQKWDEVDPSLRARAVPAR
ncbi:hypothetical protein [Microbacterium elymi]|uniref:DUF998 domain-containing protein n=1 Tax=Microbacterium elymi TaxID=2909587 RepID=A0ABY5NKE1_9MICO|nr:hypothetical protein [Microbacterium elymi]UUT35629.1 hypothetical protein L2X98_20315 [Microbacterium elymi]